jgi:hypothetical protein
MIHQIGVLAPLEIVIRVIPQMVVVITVVIGYLNH